MKNEKEYNKLSKLVTADFKARRNDFIKELKPYAAIQEIVSRSRFNSLLTPSKQKQDWNKKALIKYLIERYDLKQGIEIHRKLSEIIDILNSGELTSIKISVEWKTNRTWGSNPTAECWYSFTEEQGRNSNYIKGPSIGGCGYDKLSTAVARVLNEVPQLKRALYLLKAKKSNTPNRDLFGYGSGYGILPYIEGGVGVSCYPSIFQTIGFEFRSVASGKTYDVYEITKLKK